MAIGKAQPAPDWVMITHKKLIERDFRLSSNPYKLHKIKLQYYRLNESKNLITTIQNLQKKMGEIVGPLKFKQVLNQSLIPRWSTDHRQVVSPIEEDRWKPSQPTEKKGYAIAEGKLYVSQQIA